MCYSAQIRHEYRLYVRHHGATISLKQYYDLYWRRAQGEKIRLPKAMDANFDDPQNDDERAIKALIDAYHMQQAATLEQELFKQKKRLADAERTLLTRSTKAAAESRRIAADKIEWAKGKLSDLHRSTLTDEDSRIFPQWYAPVLIVENGQRVVKPMRYQCRPAGKPATYDRQYPGTYNARRDNLEGFWKNQFGVSHGVVVMNAFYENVSRHRVENRALAEGEKEENVVLQFRPRPTHDMLVACLWSSWRGTGEAELLSFAAITDEPPPEVAAAGHDRCIIPIKPEHLDTWLKPDRHNLDALQRILDDRERPYYEHRLAA